MNGCSPSGSADGLEEIGLDSEQVYSGNFLKVYRDNVRLPSGRVAPREYIRHPGAVVIVALLDDGQVVMERQYRYPMGRVMLELPAGKLDANEDPLLCAQRELQEETGFVGREWTKAGVMHNAIAYSNEVIHIYFARGLTQQSRQLDEEEFLDVYCCPSETLFGSVSKGELTDAKTITALYWLRELQQGRWCPQWIGFDPVVGGTVRP